MADKPRITGKLRVVIPSIVLGIGVIIGLRYGISYWLYSMKHVVTDDARIKGRMVSVAPEVSGVIKVLHVDEGSHRLTPGMVAVVGPSEVHWFENDSQENFAFVEFWGPPPKETHWLTDDV